MVSVFLWSLCSPGLCSPGLSVHLVSVFPWSLCSPGLCVHLVFIQLVSVHLVSVQVKYALLSAQRYMICQGDIARYREQTSDSANYGKARRSVHCLYLS